MCPPLRSAFFDHFPQCPLDIWKGGSEGRAPGIDHDVPLRAELRAMQPESFPNAPFDAVADHRSADSARDSKPQSSRVPGWVWACQAKGREQGTGKADTVIIDGSELGRAQNP